MSRFRPPVRAKGDGFVIDLGDDESAMVRRLVAELRALLTDAEPDSGAHSLLVRLFPVAYPDDDELEAEYQRLMRDELVQSKLSALDLVDEVLAGGRQRADTIDEGRLIAFMQSINSLRLVLGTMLGVSDDPDADEVVAGLEDSPEYHLYGYLSYLLEWSVKALTRSD
jgi:hypothetical protein